MNIKWVNVAAKEVGQIVCVSLPAVNLGVIPSVDSGSTSSFEFMSCVIL